MSRERCVTVFNCSVTGRAKSNEIFQIVGFSIVIVFAWYIVEGSERLNVMNIQSSIALGLINTASLALVIVSVSRPSGLPIPVWPIIGLPSSRPHRRVFAAHALGPPCRPARLGAEVSLANMPRPNLKLLSALIARFFGFGCFGSDAALHGAKSALVLCVTRMPLHPLVAMMAKHDRGFALIACMALPRAKHILVFLKLAGLSFNRGTAGFTPSGNKRFLADLLAFPAAIVPIKFPVSAAGDAFSALGAFCRNSFSPRFVIAVAGAIRINAMDLVRRALKPNAALSAFEIQNRHKKTSCWQVDRHLSRAHSRQQKAMNTVSDFMQSVNELHALDSGNYSTFWGFC